MSSRKAGAPEQPSSTCSQDNKSSEAVALDLTIRPIRILALESFIKEALGDLPMEDRLEIARQCTLVFEEWRDILVAEVPADFAQHKDLTIEEIACASESVLKVETDWNPIHNNIDLVRTLLDEGYAPLVDLASKYSRLGVLAVSALIDPVQAGRADSLIYLVTLIQRSLVDRLIWAKQQFFRLYGWGVEELLIPLQHQRDVMLPAVLATEKQRAALEKAAPKGAAANKARAAAARAQWRKIAWDLFERNHAWGVKDVVQRIHDTDRQLGGRTYSAATIRRAIKGVRQEWRKDFEARGRRTGLYGVDR
jgi:hypothetical protein